MITVVQSMDIKDLHQQGHSIRAIERLSGHSRNTIRKILRGEHEPRYHTPQRPSKLDAFKPYLRKRYAEVPLSAVRLLEEIRPQGYTGSLQTLRRFLRSLKPDRQAAERATVRFESKPGEQAQVDWGHCGRFPDATGKQVPVYVFVMVLSYSRMLYIEFTHSMKVPWLIGCHQRAFAAFGGVPQRILYDNMKQVRISQHQLNEEMLDFANHYGFVIKTHRAYRPQTKGKVERPMTYIKDNFLKGRSFADLADLNANGQHWLAETANVRTHGTTKERPCDRFTTTEQATLQPLTDIAPYAFVDPKSRKVSNESMVRFNGSQYSVPPVHVGQQVDVFAQAGHITIRSADVVIAEHQEAAASGQCVVNKEHLAELWKLIESQTPKPDDGKHWHLRFDGSVQSTPLATYEGVSA